MSSFSRMTMDLERVSLLGEQPLPIPKLQLFFVMAWRAQQCMLFALIFPFVNRMLEELKIANENNVGKYSASLESIAACCTFLAIFPATAISHKYGRKKPILICVTASCVASALFGFGRSYPFLLVCRSVLGLFTAHAAITKTVVAEISTPKTIAITYAFLSFSWSFGRIIAPLIGGLLSNPSEHFSFFHSIPFFQKYPYALACIFPSVLYLPIVALAIPFFRETKPSQTVNSVGGWEQKSDQPPTIFSLLRYRGIAIGLLVWLAVIFLLNVLLAAGVLFLFTSIQEGGLGLSPVAIGAIMAAKAVFTIAVATPTLALRMKLLGQQRFLLSHLLLNALVFCFYPPISFAAKSGTTWLVWLGLASVLLLEVFANGAIYCLDLLLVEIIPSKSLLPQLNGCSELAALIGTAFGTFVGGQAFAFSVSSQSGHLFSKYFVWFLGFFLSLILTIASTFWKIQKD